MANIDFTNATINLKDLMIWSSLAVIQLPKII